MVVLFVDFDQLINLMHAIFLNGCWLLHLPGYFTGSRLALNFELYYLFLNFPETAHVVVVTEDTLGRLLLRDQFDCYRVLSQLSIIIRAGVFEDKDYGLIFLQIKYLGGRCSLCLAKEMIGLNDLLSFLNLLGHFEMSPGISEYQEEAKHYHQF